MYKKLNYATGVLSAGISDSATEVVLKAGHTITTETGEANKFVGVFFDKIKSSPFQDINREIVEAYRTDTNKFTIARAKEGTSAKSWVEDDNFMLIASSAVFDEYEAELNNKQDALGFTPENITNKKTTITDSDTDYPTGRAVKTALDGKEPTLTKGNLSGSGVITIDNTRQVIGGAAIISHTDSATVRHVTDTEKATWNAKQNALGYTPENVANKRTSFQATPTDTAYPSEKLTKDSLDTKAPIISPTFATSITGSYLTASEILITDANKKIVSAPVATYPSLTELTYVKGVTSGIQSQLNNKQNTLGFTPENVANKKTTITDSDTDYLTSRAVKTAVEAREPLLTKGNLSGSGVITIDNTRQVIGGAATISHTDSATVRHVTDTEKATWNAKQNALGYTPENVANKRTSFQATPTDTAYISEKLAKDSLDAKENLANKKTTLTDNSDTYYPTQKAVKTAVDAKQDALGYTAENAANKKTSLTDNSDTYYPTQKAVKTAVDAKAPLDSPTFATSITGSYLTASEILITDANKKIISAPVATYPSLTELSYVKGVTSGIQSQLGNKAPSASPTLTGTVTLPKAVNIKDTSADHEYQLGVSELAANRTVTLPLLTGNDEFVFKDHAQTLTKKRINPRLVTAASYTTDTGTSLDVSTCDQFEITAQAGALKFNNPSGTPLGGQKLVIRIKDNGTARALTYDTQFRAIGVALPDTTVAGKTLYMGFIYNSNDTKWDLVASAQEA